MKLVAGRIAPLVQTEDHRLRDKEHTKFVSRQPCVVCGRTPADPHHLRFAQPRALGRKVSDKYTVPAGGPVNHPSFTAKPNGGLT